MKGPSLSHPGLLRDMIGWDILNWQQALALWEQYLPGRLDGWQGLELGAFRGGLSLYFGLKGVQMVCSDYVSPQSLAEPLHRKYGLPIVYLALDACRSLPFADASLDLICFKSVLGGLRKGAVQDPKPFLMAEIHRVLKPGGWLLLAENLQASPVHQLLRQRFVSWSGGWEYLCYDELLALLADFDLHCTSTGLLSLLGRNESQRRWLGQLDSRLSPCFPSSWHYLFLGAAQKTSKLISKEFIACKSH